MGLLLYRSLQAEDCNHSLLQCPVHMAQAVRLGEMRTGECGCRLT